MPERSQAKPRARAERSVVVVVENGGELPSLSGAAVHGGVIVLAQSTEELPLDFSRRVSHRITMLRASGGVVSHAVFALCDQKNVEQVAIRAPIALSLLSGLTGLGELVLEISEDAELQTRHEALALVDALMESGRGRHLQIRAFFVAPEHRSSVGPLRPLAKARVRFPSTSEALVR